MSIRVVKLGGSLLGMADLSTHLRSWLALQEPADTLLVVGGGEMVDSVRTAQGEHGLSDSEAHWLAIRAMAVQTALLRTRMPELSHVVSAAEVVTAAEALHSADGTGTLVDTAAEPRLMVLDVMHFMQDEDAAQSAEPLPENWDVSSDSIAARAAALVHADELVLLKSTLDAHAATLEEVSDAGLVDPYFARAAGEIAQVRIVNLRAPGAPEIVLLNAAAA